MSTQRRVCEYSRLLRSSREATSINKWVVNTTEVGSRENWVRRREAGVSLGEMRCVEAARQRINAARFHPQKVGTFRVDFREEKEAHGCLGTGGGGGSVCGGSGQQEEGPHGQGACLGRRGCSLS